MAITGVGSVRNYSMVDGHDGQMHRMHGHRTWCWPPICWVNLTKFR